MAAVLHFKDNFFSAGRTDIYNDRREPVGQLDLKSSFQSGVDVIGLDGRILYSGKFPLLSNQWTVTDGEGREVGKVKAKFSLLSKRFEYRANKRGTYRIESEAFSRRYDMYLDEALAASFRKVNSFLSSAAFELQTKSPEVPAEEWIAVIMGVNAITKRRQNASGA